MRNLLKKNLQIQACFGLPWKFPPDLSNIISPRSQWQNSEIVHSHFWSLGTLLNLPKTDPAVTPRIRPFDPARKPFPDSWRVRISQQTEKNDVLKADSWRYWQMQIDAQHPHIHGTVVMQTMQLLQHKMYDSGFVQVPFLSSRFKSTI